MRRNIMKGTMWKIDLNQKIKKIRPTKEQNSKLFRQKFSGGNYSLFQNSMIKYWLIVKLIPWKECSISQDTGNHSRLSMETICKLTRTNYLNQLKNSSNQESQFYLYQVLNLLENLLCLTTYLDVNFLPLQVDVQEESTVLW